MVCEVDWVTIQRGIRAWVAGGSGLPLSSVYWGQQDSKKVAEPSIDMRVYSNHTIGLPWVSAETAYVTFTPLPVTLIAAVTDTVSIPNHGFTNGDGPVQMVSTGTIPGGLLASTDYWVIVVDANNIKLASTFRRTGGAYVAGVPSGNPVTPVNITTAGTGTITVVSTARTLRAGAEMHYVARSIERLAIMLTCFATDAVGLQAAMSLMGRIKARQRLPSQQEILRVAGIGLNDVERARAIHGVRNAVQFEPRALMEVYFNLPVEACEDGTIIESADITNLITGITTRVE